MAPLRVLHVASGREWRGGQRQVHLLARGLAARADVETLVVTGGGTALAERLTADGVPVRTTGWRAGLDPRVAVTVATLLRPGTLVHAHDAHAHALATLALRLRPAPLVVTRRVDLPIRSPRRFQRAARIIALSDAIAARLRDAGIAPDRIAVVPPGIDLAAAALPLPWPAMLPAVDVGRQLIVTIAALTAEKGIDLLLEAAARLRSAHPRLHWIVLGEGRERPALEARRTALGLDDVVSLPGHLPQPEAVLARATLAVQPSRREGFGSSVLDALALGVPVVATATGGLPEALAHGGGVLVPPEEPAALADAIAALLGDADGRARLRDASRRAARRFGVDRLVEATVDVYRSPMTVSAR